MQNRFFNTPFGSIKTPRKAANNNQGPTKLSLRHEDTLEEGHELEPYQGQDGFDMETERLQPVSVDDEGMVLDYFRRVTKNSDLISGEDEIALAKRIEAGDAEAKRKLAQANLRLVISIAKRYAGRGANFLDLVQEGNLGLMKAIEKYNYRLGYRFSTYATWWIKQGIAQGFSEHDRPVRLPSHIIDTVSKLKRAKHQLERQLNRMPTDEELATFLQLSVKKVRQIQEVSQKVISLEAETILKDGNTQSLLESLEDDSKELPEEGIWKHESLKALRRAFQEVLKPREQEILSLRFGLKGFQPQAREAMTNDFGDKKMTLEEIGQRYGVTRECIRQTERRALDKLRHSTHLKQMVD